MVFVIGLRENAGGIGKIYELVAGDFQGQFTGINDRAVSGVRRDFFEVLKPFNKILVEGHRRFDFNGNELAAMFENQVNLMTLVIPEEK